MNPAFIPALSASSAWSAPPALGRRLLLAGLCCGLAGMAGAAGAQTASVGATAPGFSAKDTSGKTVSLADFKGKTVVLEWVNPGCPYVRRHYSANNMQGTQKSATDKGVVWLAVNSTASEHQDYLTPEKMSGWMREQRASANATLIDTDGKIGRAYGARTTPHMYIIDTQGKLAYAGAIDNKPMARGAEIATATNHVNQALAELLANKPVSVAATQPYGCSVKYSAM
jgi:peroxiredoxin